MDSLQLHIYTGEALWGKPKAWFTIRRWGDAGASVKSAEHNQHRIVNEFYVGTLGALVRATATQGIDSISIRALASVTFR